MFLIDSNQKVKIIATVLHFLLMRVTIKNIASNAVKGAVKLRFYCRLHVNW